MKFLYWSYLLDEGQQGLFVVLPLQRKFTFMGKLVAAQEDGQLEAVGVQVAEVVHTCRGSPEVRKCFTALWDVESFSLINGSCFCGWLLIDQSN